MIAAIEGHVVQHNALRLELEDIQADLVIGMQKNAELFIFFQIIDPVRFKAQARQYLAGQLTTARMAQDRKARIDQRRRLREAMTELWSGLNVGFTASGLTKLLGVGRPRLGPAFERGAGDPETIAALADPPASKWVRGFRADRIDGVFLIAGSDPSFAAYHGNALRDRLGAAIEVVYSEIGKVRPGRNRGYEHFGFRDGVSQPAVRGMSRSYQPAYQPAYQPDQRPTGDNLIWPGEFVFGYPGQHPDFPEKEGPPPEMAAPWMRNGSFMVFRRLDQKVPEFRRFVADQAARLGIDRELLAARMVGRWKSGAPLELAPLRDDPRLGADDGRNNDFAFGQDPEERRCPFAAHIRKVYPRDDIDLAEAQRHRIIRAGIAFGPEVEPGETTTRHSRGLMFVCYQTSIERQFEFIQKNYASCPGFVGGKRRPGTGLPVRPGYDPIIGQAPGGGARAMDEPYPNYPAGDRRSTLEMPEPFVVLTAAGYFFMPSITTLRTVLTR